MGFFVNLSIRNKVLTAFCAILLLTVSLGLFSVTRVEFLNTRAAALSTNAQVALPLGLMAKDAHQMAELIEKQHLLATLTPTQSAALPPNTQQAIATMEASTSQDFAAQWKIYGPTMDPGRETTDGNNFNQAFGELVSASAEIAGSDNQGDHGDALGIITGDMASDLTSFDNAMNDDLSYQASQTSSLAQDAVQASTQGVLWIGVLLCIIAAGTLAVGWLIVRGIATPIGQMTAAMRKLAQQDMNVKIPGIGRGDELGAMAAAVQVFKENGQERLKLEAEAAQFRQELDQKVKAMETAFEAAGRDQKLVVDGLAVALSAMAKGDLTARLTQDVADAYQTLKSDFNAAMDTLQETMKAIAASTQGVRSGAGEITSASDDLAHRTEQQAASLEQTAAALDQITATVRKTADGASEARKVATGSKTDAEHSGAVIDETVKAMSSIDNSSREISNIIGVIDEIAFQTNLLALNAGVEAARAGDAGRGFAVVATEVRALAQRSADAAKEIKTLISASRQQVESGVRLVDETGTALARIVGQVTKLNELITDIAASAQEQATGLNEVNSAVNQMDQVTQQNAAMVEETTAASHSLASEASELARLVGQFHTGEQAAAPSPRAPRPPTAGMPKPSRIPVHAPTTSKPRPVPAGAHDEGWDEF
jgi:methyl-accepting chemotaxis protein